MDFNDRELFVYRIISGVVKIKVCGATLKIMPPTTEVYLEACEKYHETLHNSYTMGIKDEQELTNILIDKDLWSWHDEKALSRIPKDMDDYRLNAYENRNNAIAVNSAKVGLVRLEKELQRLVEKKHKYMHTTCESLASTEKIYHLIKNSCFKNGSLCNFDDYNIESIVLEYNEFHNVNERVLRYLSRTQPWSNIWSTKKRTNQYFFSHPELEMTNNQKTLIAFSQMYDSVSEASERPLKDVLEDDVLLDGWFISQVRNNERKEFERDFDSSVSNSKIKHSGEVYSIVGNNKSRAEKVEAMNNPHAKHVKKERENLIKSAKGPVSQGAFMDEKLKLTQQSNSKFKDKFNGR